MANAAWFEGHRAILDELRASMTRCELTRGATVFEEGSPGESLFVVETGAVKVTRAAAGQRSTAPTILAILGPDDLFGETSLLNGSLRGATVTAIRTTTLLELTRDAFDRELARNPALAVGLMRDLAARIRASSDAVTELVYTDVPSRVARALVTLAQKFSVAGESGRIRVDHQLTQGELAEFVGSSRESVDKALALLERTGVIEAGQRCVTITNYERLRARAGLTAA